MKTQRWEVAVFTKSGEKYYRYLEEAAAKKSYQNKKDWYKARPYLKPEVQLNDLESGENLKVWTTA